MSETPNAEYFIASLHNAGWEGTLDAQHEKIEALWKRITDERRRELAAMTARAELAERQVAVLCTRLCTLVNCGGCPAKTDGCLTKCDITTAAWSRAEAEKVVVI